MHNAHNKSIFAFWNFSDKLKIAKVTPIHKKGDSKLITNYRPISVLPVISKIFETVICDQLNHYFISKTLICVHSNTASPKFRQQSWLP